MREEITNMNEEVKEIKSFAMELYQDSKNANKRICRVFTIIILVIVIGYFVTVGLWINSILEYPDKAIENYKQKLDAINKNYELSKQYENFDERFYKTYEKEIGEMF